jgi:hypothetical protein
MSNDGPMIVSPSRVALVDSVDAAREGDVRTRATRDRMVIQHWPTGSRRPACDRRDDSVRNRHDFQRERWRDAGIRFNFPGHAPYRAISWDEWFDACIAASHKGVSRVMRRPSGARRATRLQRNLFHRRVANISGIDDRVRKYRKRESLALYSRRFPCGGSYLMSSPDSRQSAQHRSCPQCQKTENVRIAFITPYAVFFHCEPCRFQWSIPKEPKAPGATEAS